jgi:hypothetical protein
MPEIVKDAKSGARNFWSVAVASALVLTPYGNINSVLEKKNPFHGFQSDDPVLSGVRIERETTTDCSVWVRAFINNTRSIKMGRPTSFVNETQWSAWLPIEKNEKEAIEECHEEPCSVKLNEAEVKLMADTPDAQRFQKYLGLVIDRADAYVKNQTRSSYEYAGGITDPWKYFDQNGYKSELAMPASASLGLRTLDFHNSRARPIRQMVDRRLAIAPDFSKATIWVRDIYTNHYFDSWGEWGNITCEPSQHQVTVTLAVNVEFDVLKNTGLFASISRGSARSSMQSTTEEYLDTWWEQIKASAEKALRK